MRYLQNCYLTDLAPLGVAGALHLIGTSFGEANTEQPEHVVVSCLDIHMSLNEGLPLLNQ